MTLFSRRAELKGALEMKPFARTFIAATAIAGGALMGSAPVNAQVHIGIGVPGVHVGVGVGTPAFYGPGFYPPGPCDTYNYYYQGDCGYAVYNGPVAFDGVTIGGPHYYRWYNGQPLFWYRGGWHSWRGWTRANFGWDHGEGWGWRGGHWDRGLGNANWHGGDRGRGLGPRDDRGDYRGGRDHEDHHEHGEGHRGR
jgi:hypothetical protein